ncbi:hypothetical protein SAMN05880561_11313 [Rhizobium sp. RU33A]|uniref:hypothetical protein n=1 Tax=Rhizobium sp. RU33A TaxID=1907413 RepID=UPI00095447E7|nr:hypothetical protein [Rhizobium sp. RU33A]SIR14791.1 hypothetical protein SAMN05880561_11313 [Rhizobium sp. RU33A]
MKWAKSGLPSVFPKVNNKQSMIFIDNLTDLLRVTIHHPNAANRLFLASDKEALSTHEILSQLIIVYGRTLRSIPMPLAATDYAGKTLMREQAVRRLTKNLEVDLSETTQKLGWEPPFSVIDGLSRTVTGDHYRSS